MSIRWSSFFFIYFLRDSLVNLFDLAIPKEQTIFRFTVPLSQTSKNNDNNNDPDEKMTDNVDENAIDTTSDLKQEKERELVFELHGSQFRNRPVDRANKKFKWRNIEYL